MHLWNEDRSMPYRYRNACRPSNCGPADKFFILGKPGAGKTTFLKCLAVREAQRGRWVTLPRQGPDLYPPQAIRGRGKDAV